MTFNIGDRVRFIDPDPLYDRIRGWEGTITKYNFGQYNSTYNVTLYNPYDINMSHQGCYFSHRLQLLSQYTVSDVIAKLQKRQKFYQTYKAELPTWYACYGD